jgi:hypothetical protein
MRRNKGFVDLVLVSMMMIFFDDFKMIKINK